MAADDEPKSNPLHRLARLPFWWAGRRPLQPPRKALILQPCCLGRVMLTTPLLAALSEAFPWAQFDWAVSDWARQAVASNPRVTRLIRTGAGDLKDNSPAEMRRFLDEVKQEAYDTCFVPAHSSLLAQVAWRAGIPQRVGLNAGGRGFTHTVAVKPPAEARNPASAYLSLARAAGVDDAVIEAAEMEFEPPDRDRAAITRWLVEEFDWLGDRPLVVMHPGGGENPAQSNLNKRWPAERFTRLANHLARAHGARVVLVDTAEGRPLAAEIAGMMSFPAANRAGELGLGELGALCELADLYVGNDVGSTYVAAATGCATLAIFGPTDPAVGAPYMITGHVTSLWHPYDGEFSWARGVTVEEAAAAADDLLAEQAAEAAAALL